MAKWHCFKGATLSSSLHLLGNKQNILLLKSWKDSKSFLKHELALDLLYGELAYDAFLHKNYVSHLIDHNELFIHIYIFFKICLLEKVTETEKQTRSFNCWFTPLMPANSRAVSSRCQEPWMHLAHHWSFRHISRQLDGVTGCQQLTSVLQSWLFSTHSAEDFLKERPWNRIPDEPPCPPAWELGYFHDSCGLCRGCTTGTDTALCANGLH